MAQAINDLYAGGFPHYDDLAFATNNKPGRADLQLRCSHDALEYLSELEIQKNAAMELSREYVALTGEANEMAQELARECNAAFQEFQESLFAQHPDLQEPISRSAVDTSSPGNISKKIHVPIMGAAAAMRMLINPKSEYYGSASDLNGSIDARFPTEFARCGGMPIIPLDVSIEDAIALIKEMKNSHDVYRKPVFVHPETTIREVRELLMGQVKDAAVYVVDKDKKLLRIINREEVELGENVDQTKRKLNDSDAVSKIFSMDTPQRFKTAPVGTTAAQALKMMTDLNVHELPIVDEESHVLYMLSETQAALSDELKESFKVDGNLGMMFTVGIGPFNDMAERADDLMEAGACGFFIETAHAYRRDVIAKSVPVLKQIRERYPNAVIGFGTVTEPEAVELLSFLGIDVVKVGVGGGGHCSTFDVTGVGGLPFRSFRECAETAEALGNIQIMADGGINSTRRFNLAASNNGTALVQFGTWLGSTVESASKAEFIEGRWRKLVFGEASDHAEGKRRQERRLDDRLVAMWEKLMERFHRDKILGIHSEGKVTHRIIPEGPNSHVGGVMLGIRRSLQSWASYSNARNMQQAQERSRIMRITNTKT